MVIITAQIYLDQRVDPAWRARGQALMALKAVDIVRIFAGYADAVGESRLPSDGAIRNLDPATQARDIQTNPANPYHARFMKGDADVSKMVDDLLARSVAGGRK